MRSICLCILCSIACSSWTRAADPTTPAQYAATMEAVFEAVLENHIEPPTRQQMVLGLLRSLRENESQLALSELAKIISDVSDKASLYGIMRQEVERYAAKLPLDSKRLNRTELDWLDRIVPGGVSLTDPKNADVEEQLAANRYVGIGVQLAKNNDGYFFPQVMDRGTAARAGILSGDQLIRVNDLPMSEDLGEIIDQLRGPEGSHLRLTVRTGEDEPRNVELRRQVVVIDSVKLEPLQPGQKTVFIDVENIKASTVHELQTIIERLPEDVTDINLTLDFDGNFHYFVLFADALLDQCHLGEMVTRQGRRAITMSDGNVLAGRKLQLEVHASAEHKQLLDYLSLHMRNPKRKSEFGAVQAVFLQESLPILDGTVIVSLATRKFQRGVQE